MVLFPLTLGSCLGYIVSFLAQLRAQHPWQLQVSLHLKFKPLGDGDQTL
jgi:hypothetical protein